MEANNIELGDRVTEALAWENGVWGCFNALYPIRQRFMGRRNI